MKLHFVCKEIERKHNMLYLSKFNGKEAVPIPGRKFRFDYAFPDIKLAIEYEGINSKNSRHTNIKGYTNDCIKYNLATLNGWHVLRYTCINITDAYNDINQFVQSIKS